MSKEKILKKDSGINIGINNQQSKFARARKKVFCRFRESTWKSDGKKPGKYVVVGDFRLIFAHFESFFSENLFRNQQSTSAGSKKKDFAINTPKIFSFLGGNQSTGPRFARPNEKRKKINMNRTVRTKKGFI